MAKLGGDLTTGQVAEFFNVTPAMVRSWGRLTDGLRPQFTPGGHRRYPADQVLEFDRQRRR